MPNPWAGSKFYAKLGNLCTRPVWSILPAPRGFGIITTVGRRSGKPRRQSVRAIRQGDDAYLVAMMGNKAAWLKNVRAHPEVTLRLGRGISKGTVREIADPSERERAMHAYTTTVVPADYVDFLAYHWGLPTRSKIIRAHQQWFEEGIPLVVHIESD